MEKSSELLNDRELMANPSEDELVEDKVVLYTNVFSHYRLKCEKQNAVCLNAMLNHNNTFYLVKNCHHLVCEKCYIEVKTLSESKQLNPGNKNVCSYCNNVQAYTSVQDLITDENSSKEKEILKTYITFLGSIAEYKKDYKKYENCFFHKEKKPSHIYFAFHENNDEDSLLCEECFEKYNKVDKGEIATVSETLNNFENFLDGGNNFLEKEINILKSKLDKTENIIGRINSSNSVLTSEIKQTYSEMSQKIENYNFEVENKLREEKDKNIRIIDERIQLLKKYKNKLETSIEDIDFQLVESISDADYQTENVANLLKSSTFMHKLISELNDETDKVKAEDILIPNKIYSMQENSVKTKIEEIVKINLEEQDLNSEVPLY